MEKKYKIKETKELLKLIITSTKLVMSAKSGFKAGQVALFAASIPQVMKAFGGITDVPNELKDLDEAETAELKDMIVKEFPGTTAAKSAKVLEVILGMIQQSYTIYELVKEKPKQSIAKTVAQKKKG